MYPFAFEGWFESVSLPSYGLMLALGFTLGYLEAIRRALVVGQDPKHVERLFFLLVISTLGGARLFHVFFEDWAYYRTQPWQILAIWSGGFTFYGGLFAGFVVFWTYCRATRMSVWSWLDTFTPSTLLGMSLGRLGCFAAGCCWGKPTLLPWGVTYSHPHTLAGLRGIPVHPVQLYEALGTMALFLYTQWLFRRRPPAGTVFLHALGFYAALRFIVEFYRGDAYRGFIAGTGLSLGQFFSLGLLAAVCVQLLIRRSRLAPGSAVHRTSQKPQPRY